MPINNFDFHLGVDMTGKEKKSHFRYLENLWRKHDREGADASLSSLSGVGRALERTAGFRRLLSTGEKIHSLFHCEHDKSLIIHAGKRLYRLTSLGVAGLPESESEEESRRTSYAPATLLFLKGTASDGSITRVTDFLPERQISAAEVGDRLYLADGVRLYCFNKLKLTVVVTAGTCKIDGATITTVTEPYIPLRSLDGTDYEQRNLLTNYYRQSYTFSDTDTLNEGNSPILFIRTGQNAEGVPTCRANGCQKGDFGDTLIIPSSTVVDGVTCAVTEIIPSLISGRSTFKVLVMPHTIQSIPNQTLLNCPAVHTVRLPLGVNEVYLCFFNECASNLTIEYEGNASQWSLVQVHTEGYTGKYTLRYGFSEHAEPYGIRLAEKSNLVTSVTFDGTRVTNQSTDTYRIYPIRETADDSSPYTHLYILAKTNLPLSGKKLTLIGRALPFRYTSETGIHALETTEGALAECGVTTGNPDASADDVPEGQALLRGCRLMTAYDRRLFLSGLPAIPDVIFYSHEDADGNPNPTYIAAMNYMTDSDRMAVTGLYSADGELCVTHASRTRGKLQTHTYALPDIADSLFIRLYPVKAVYSVGRVIAATVFKGRLHLLTDDGILSYARSSSDGYLTAKVQSGRISPVIHNIAVRRTQDPAPFFASLGNRLALFDGTDLYFGDSELTSRHDGAVEYEWYPQTAVGSHSGDEMMFASCDDPPAYLRDAFFINEDLEIIPLHCEEGDKIYKASEVEERTAKTLEHGFFYDHHVFCARKSGALVDTLGYRSGGKISPPTAAVLYDDLLVFGTEEGALCAFNTDLTYEEEGHAYYLCDSHRVTAALQTFSETEGRRAERKRTRAGSSYVFLRPMASSAPTLTLRQDERDSHFALPAAPLEFDRLEFDKLGFLGGDTVAIPIPERYDYIEKSYIIDSDNPFAFLGLTYTYDVRK